MVYCVCEMLANAVRTQWNAVQHATPQCDTLQHSALTTLQQIAPRDGTARSAPNRPKPLPLPPAQVAAVGRWRPRARREHQGREHLERHQRSRTQIPPRIHLQRSLQPPVLCAGTPCAFPPANLPTRAYDPRAAPQTLTGAVPRGLGRLAVRAAAALGEGCSDALAGDAIDG